MNRLPFYSADNQSGGTVQVADNPKHLLARTPLNLTVPHRLFFPQHFESRYQYPFFIWLHSNDSSEMELDEVAPAVSLRNYVSVGLRGPKASPSKSRYFQWSLRSDILAISEEIILETIRLAVEDLAIDPGKVFIGGFGTGGSVAQWMALRHPATFNAAISVNGSAPDKPGSLVNWKQRQKTKVLFMYGENSSLCDAGQVVDSIHFAHRSSLNYQFAQFNCGDDFDEAMTSLMNNFMMEAIVQPI